MLQSTMALTLLRHQLRYHWAVYIQICSWNRLRMMWTVAMLCLRNGNSGFTMAAASQHNYGIPVGPAGDAGIEKPGTIQAKVMLWVFIFSIW